MGKSRDYNSKATFKARNLMDLNLKVSVKAQYLSTMQTISASLYRGKRIVSGHMCFKIISFSIGLRTKILLALKSEIDG